MSYTDRSAIFSFFFEIIQQPNVHIISMRYMMKEYKNRHDIEYNKKFSQKCGVLWSRILSLMIQNHEIKPISNQAYQILVPIAVLIAKYSHVQMIKWDQQLKRWMYI